MEHSKIVYQSSYTKSQAIHHAKKKVIFQYTTQSSWVSDHYITCSGQLNKQPVLKDKPHTKKCILDIRSSILSFKSLDYRKEGEATVLEMPDASHNSWSSY